jgi:hypothetical protein
VNANCQWLEDRLEAFCCDRLSEEDERTARSHIENCPQCHGEIQSLRAIDPVIKRYFNQQLALAQAPRRVRQGFVLGLAGSSIAAVLALIVLLNHPAGPPPLPPIAAQPESAPAAATESVPENGRELSPPVVRAKPQPDAAPATLRTADPVGANAPDFRITDPIGYTRTLADYRGRIVVVAAWHSSQPEATANFERLYQTFGSQPRFRFLGVSTEAELKPPDTTFPAVYNQGSRILGAGPGGFVLVDESGTVRLRGSLVADLESLQRYLQAH